MMRCFFSRWAISNAADSGEALSPRARRHVDGCAACRDFQRGVAALDDALMIATRDAPRPTDVSAPEPGRMFGRGLAGLTAVAAITAVVATLYVAKDPPVHPGSHQGMVSESVAVSDKGSMAQEPISPDAIDTLTRDAEQGLRYVLRVSGLPD